MSLAKSAQQINKAAEAGEITEQKSIWSKFFHSEKAINASEEEKLAYGLDDNL